jgi:hypothetical protein
MMGRMNMKLVVVLTLVALSALGIWFRKHNSTATDGGAESERLVVSSGSEKEEFEGLS